MKKFLAIVFTILFVNNIASATTVVTYNNAGARMTVQRGASAPRSAFITGRNAAFLPKNTAAAARRHRAIAREEAITRAIANYGNNKPYNNSGCCNNRRTNTIASSAPAQISRLNKSYTVKTQKSYTRNGITYYN